MKVLLDFHHDELYESLVLLFEKRLGFEVYRPIGPAWYHEGYWKIYDHPATVEQYLGFTTALPTFVGHTDNENGPANDQGEILRYQNWDPKETYPGILEVASPVYEGKRYKCITLEQFKNQRFDIIVSSIPAHIEPHKQLIERFQPHAKHIFQAGNNWPSPYPRVQNILSSSRITLDHNANAVFYHQEFDLGIFNNLSSPEPKRVANMMHYIQEKETFELLESKLPDWQFHSYGAGNRDGSRGPSIKDVAASFNEHGFIWHVKKEGDGYGYSLHHSFACGRPLITRCSHFTGMTAEPLLVDGVTCIDLDRHHIDDVSLILSRAAHEYKEWTDRAYKRFKEVVDFDHEFEDIKVFMSNLR